VTLLSHNEGPLIIFNTRSLPFGSEPCVEIHTETKAETLNDFADQFMHNPTVDYLLPLHDLGPEKEPGGLNIHSEGDLLDPESGHTYTSSLTSHTFDDTLVDSLKLLI
jgi:hypothetical protein